MSTYTSSIGLEQITPGDQAGLWGNTTNNNLALIDQAVTGVTPISFAALSGSTYTLTDYNGAVDEARSAVLNITGNATGSNTVVIPNKQKTYLVRNNTGQNVVCRTASPTASYTVEAGNSILIFCDGNNSVFTGIASPSVGTLSVSAGGTGSTTFTAGFVKSPGGTGALTSSSAVSLTADVSGTLPVTSGGTGAGTFTSGSLLVGNGTSNFGTLAGSANGQVATWNGSQWTATLPAAAAVTSVTGSGNISVSPTTGATVVSITSSPTFSSTSAGALTATTGNFSGLLTASAGVSTGLVSTTGSTVSLGINGSPNISYNNLNIFFPNADNTVSLGSGGNRWTIVYAVNGTINTSDGNEKQQIRDISAAEKAVAQTLKTKLKAFKFNDAVAKKGENARTHFGIIAQDIKAAFEAEGLDPDKYGVFCSDTLKDGSVRLGVRYDQLFALIISAI